MLTEFLKNRNSHALENDFDIMSEMNPILSNDGWIYPPTFTSYDTRQPANCQFSTLRRVKLVMEC